MYKLTSHCIAEIETEEIQKGYFCHGFDLHCE